MNRAEYLAALPSDRREAIAVVRQVVLDNVGAGIEAGVQSGMLSYHVLH